MTDLANRYGAPSAGRRRALVAFVVVLAVAGLGWLTWAIVYQSTPEVRSDVLRFTIPDDHTATVTATVVRASTDTQATCFFRALAEDHTVVGEASLPVTSGAKHQDVTATLRTERRATSVEGLGCSAPGQNERR